MKITHSRLICIHNFTYYCMLCTIAHASVCVTIQTLIAGNQQISAKLIVCMRNRTLKMMWWQIIVWLSLTLRESTAAAIAIVIAIYGLFSFQMFCIHNAYSVWIHFVCDFLKQNPVNPERCFKYTVPVTAVAFSNENSQLLAIGKQISKLIQFFSICISKAPQIYTNVCWYHFNSGFYDGHIRIIDITIGDACNLVAISDRKTSPPIEPIWQMKWIKCMYMWNIFICIFIQTLYHDCYLPFDLSLLHFANVHRYFLYPDWNWQYGIRKKSFWPFHRMVL